MSQLTVSSPAPATGARPAARSAPSESERGVLRSFASRIDGADPGAYNNLGVLYFTRGMADEAVDAFAQALDLDPKMTVAQRNLEIAAFASGVYERRVTAWRAELERHPEDRKARQLLGRLFYQLGQLQQAMEQFEVLQQADPSDVDTLKQLAYCEQKSGNMDAAARWAQRAIALEPSDARLHHLSAEVAYHRGLNDEALASLQRATACDPDLADAHFLLGFVLGDVGRHDEAGEATRRAMRINPSLGRAHANLSLERFDAGSYSATRALRLERGVAEETRVDANGVLAHYHLGLAFRQKGYLVEALREYRLALERGEHRAMVMLGMAEVHLLRAESAAAAQLYERLLDEDPANAKLWNERGVALHQEGRYAEACGSYERAVEADPACVHAWNNLGVAHSHAGRSDLALASLRRALQVDAKFVKARLNLALLLFKHGEHQLCLETHRQVLQMEPEHPVAWNGVGIVLAALRHFEDARNAFGRAIDARPAYAEAHYNLSFTLSNLGDFAGALRATKRALELDPFYVPQKFELAIDLAFEDPSVNISPDLGAERRDEAIANFAFDPAALSTLFAELERPGQASPQGAGGSYAEARAALASGEVERAIVEAGRALGSGADAREGLLLLGDLFARAGAFGEALDRYSQARALDPDGIEALAGEARMLTLLGRGREAAEQAELLLARAPSDVDMLRAVARVRADDERYAAALETLETARRLAPLRADTVKDIGDVARRMGDDARALESYRYAITLDRDFASARVDLAAILTQHGLWDDAERELVAALVTLPGYTAAALALAALRRTMARPGDTIDLLVEVLRRDPYHLDALASLGESLFLSGCREDAAIAFARVLRFDRNHVAALYFEGVMLAEERRYEDAMGRWQRVSDLEPASDFARRALRDSRTASDLQRIFTTREHRGAA